MPERPAADTVQVMVAGVTPPPRLILPTTAAVTDQVHVRCPWEVRVPVAAAVACQPNVGAVP